MRFSSLALTSIVLMSMLTLTACNKHNNDKPDDTLTATSPVTGEASPLTDKVAQQRFQQALQANLEKAGIKMQVQSVRATELPNMYWVTLNGAPPILVTSDAKYVFQGEVVGLGDNQIKHVTDNLLATDNKDKLAALDKKDLIIYPAQGKTKHVIYVFTDANCPYCHKLHAQIPEMNSKGIEVRYIAWPRGDQFMPSMEAIWCSADRKAAFASVVAGVDIPLTQCQSPVRAEYELGLGMGVQGTPAIYNENGQYLAGYIETDNLLQLLEKK